MLQAAVSLTNPGSQIAELFCNGIQIWLRLGTDHMHAFESKFAVSFLHDRGVRYARPAAAAAVESFR